MPYSFIEQRKKHIFKNHTSFIHSLCFSFLICDIRETAVPVLLTLHTFYEHEMQWYFCEHHVNGNKLYTFTVTPVTVKRSSYWTRVHRSTRGQRWGPGGFPTTNEVEVLKMSICKQGQMALSDKERMGLFQTALGDGI